MDIQKSCEIMEKMLNDDYNSKLPKLSMEEFLAINHILLDLNLSGKYEVKELPFD